MDAGVGQDVIDLSLSLLLSLPLSLSPLLSLLSEGRGRRVLSCVGRRIPQLWDLIKTPFVSFSSSPILPRFF